jgi:hypothetical protein
MNKFRFKCATCDAWHEGMPTFGFDAPLYYYSVPEAERKARCVLGSDDCIVDDEFFFVRGCLEIPVRGGDEPFVWGVWTSLSRANYEAWREAFPLAQRSHIGPFFGWLSAALPLYPETENLKTMVHLRDKGVRPFVEVEPTQHPLAIEQSEGIEVSRVGEIYSYFMHQNGA